MQAMADARDDLMSDQVEQCELKLLNSMADEFAEQDLNDDGEINLEEFGKMIKRPSMIQKLKLMGVMSHEAESLFEIMDVDHSDSVSPQEFVTGLQKLRG